MADGLRGSSALLPELPLSGSTITSSRYQTRQAFSLSRQQLYLIPRTDQARLVRKNLTGYRIPPSSSSRAVLTALQFSCCFSWCGYFSFTTARSVLKTIKNRYWPLWYMIWLFVGRCMFQSTRRPFSAPAQRSGAPSIHRRYATHGRTSLGHR